MNILVILPWNPFLMNSGGDQAMINGIKALKENFNVYITYYERKKNILGKLKLSKILNTNQIIPFTDQINKTKYFIFKSITNKIIQFLFHKNEDYKIDCLNEFRPCEEEFSIFINKIIDDYSIDIVQTEMLRNSSIIFNLPKKVKKIFVHHEIGFIKNNLLKKWLPHNYKLNSTIAISKINEIAILNLYDAIITLSSIDKIKLEEAGIKTPIYSSFAIVEDRIIKNTQHINNTTLSFIGPEGHAPNLLGLKWFLNHCWNNILKYNNEYKLRVIGNWSKKTISCIQGEFKNIEFLGYVNDLTIALSGTRMIVPITIGSGIRMKILEAANIGIPIITTSIGVEGIPLKDGINCFIADEPEEFIQKIIESENIETQIKYIESAKQIVKKYYSISALADNRKDIINKLYE